MNATTPAGADPLAPPALATDGPVSYAIMRLAKAHRAAAAVLLRDLGLHAGQELLLMQLWERDDRAQAELVRALQLDPSTVARMVARLEDQGIIRRTASSTDRRAVVVSLTERGRGMAAGVRRMWSRLEEITVAGLPSADRERFLDLARRIALNIADPS